MRQYGCAASEVFTLGYSASCDLLYFVHNALDPEFHLVEGRAPEADMLRHVHHKSMKLVSDKSFRAHTKVLLHQVGVFKSEISRLLLLCWLVLARLVPQVVADGRKKSAEHSVRFRLKVEIGVCENVWSYDIRKDEVALHGHCVVLPAHIQGPYYAEANRSPSTKGMSRVKHYNKPYGARHEYLGCLSRLWRILVQTSNVDGIE
jgi:hypothetical protein